MLLMPLVRFISARDPRWLGTMALIKQELVEDALVFRRAPADRALDGLDGQEGLVPCMLVLVCGVFGTGRRVGRGAPVVREAARVWQRTRSVCGRIIAGRGDIRATIPKR